MSQPNTNEAPAKQTLDLEQAFKRHQDIVPKVKKAYADAIAQVFTDLSAEDLAPLASIMLENEDIELNTEDLIETMRARMTEVLSQLNDYFLESNDVGNKLITLEVLKEKFAAYEGTDWCAYDVTPEQRARSIRVQLMNSSIRYMQKQVDIQQKAIEMAKEESQSNRERIQHTQNERTKLYALMQKQSEHYKQVKVNLMELQDKLNHSE